MWLNVFPGLLTMGNIFPKNVQKAWKWNTKFLISFSDNTLHQNHKNCKLFW